MPFKIMLLHIGERDQENYTIVSQMRSVGPPFGDVAGDIHIPRNDLLVHITDATTSTGEGSKPDISAKSGCGAGAILMYDTTRRSSFVRCRGWIDAFRAYAFKEAVVLLLANRSHESSARKREVSHGEGKGFADQNGALYQDVHIKKPDSSIQALYHIVECIYGKMEEGLLGTGTKQGVMPVKMPVQSPLARRHTTSCASPTSPTSPTDPLNSLPMLEVRSRNSQSLGESIPEVAKLESQLSFAEEEVERMKEHCEAERVKCKQLLTDKSQDLASAKREIESLKWEKTALEQTLQRDKQSLAQQLAQAKSEVWSLQQSCATLQQLNGHRSSLEQENRELRQALEAQAQESANVKWQLQHQLRSKEEALENEIRVHSDTRAILRETQLALHRAREENRQLQHSQRPAEINYSWNVSRGEVVINEAAALGHGAWGYVAEGEFRGKRVAVKCLHEEIMASATLQRVRREIHTMAGIRHPNIVLFMAAVLDNEDPPLIISELLDTNLRAAYEDRLLNGTGTKMEILHGVACALNYLHKLREPIIHRDLSSPNVLLRATNSDKWIPKLSDFGSANLGRHSQTLGEGAVIYAAPETFPKSPYTSLPQTTKIDVYSFGVLAGELLTEQLPDPDSLSSTLQRVGAEWPQLHRLVVCCTQHTPLHRPNMDTVITAYFNPLLAHS